MTGFASADFLTAEQINSDQVARRAFAAFFIPNGLPKLILLDQGRENKGHLINMCNTSGINFHVIAPDQHNGILCERFHRYLNNKIKTHRFTYVIATFIHYLMSPRRGFCDTLFLSAPMATQ
jgi:hypothetical protein